MDRHMPFSFLGELLYTSAGVVSGTVQGVATATIECVTTVPRVLLQDPGLVLKGTKHSKKLEANGFAEPKRALENGVKSVHNTVASATAHTKAAHLPSDSKIAQMSSKPMAHVEAKG